MVWKLPKYEPPFRADGPCCRVYFQWTKNGYILHRSMFALDFVWRGW